MASPESKVSDQNNPGQDEFDELIDRQFSPGDERMMEERAAAPEQAADAESEKNDGKPGSTDPVGEEYERLRGVVGDKWQSAKDADGGSFWKEGKNDKGILKRMRQRRRTMVALGAGGTLIIAAGIGLFGFLNVFKLDHIMQNIDAQSFARLNGVEDRRSFYWMRAYMIARMGEIETPGDSAHPEDRKNIFFRGERVGTGDPFGDWYKTMRTSKFEQDVFEKNGIKFTSVAVPKDGGGYRIRPGIITLNDTEIRVDPSGIDYNKIAAGDVGEINKFQQGFDSKVFDNNKSARQDIKKAVQDNTRFYQLMKRRMLRKSIQNMTGVKSWRFFETTRDKVDEKKIDIRNKILAKAIPENTASGKFMRCLFGISDCRKSDDVDDPQNRASTTEVTGTDNPGADEVKTKDAAGNPVNEKFDPNDIFSKILGKAGVGTLFSAANVAGTMDMLAKIDTNIHNGSLSKMVTVARGTQAVGLYTTFEIARDQMRSGQANPAEINQFMQVIGNTSSSEGWAGLMNSDVPAPKVADSGKTIAGGIAQWLTKPAYAAGNDPSDGTTRQKFCSQEHQAWVQKPENKIAANKEHQFICADKQIGGKNGADILKKSYDASIGIVIHPIANVINGAEGVPVLGDIFKGLVSISSLFGKIASPIVSEVAQIAGVGDDIAKFALWIGQQTSSFMGAGPINSGPQEADGQYVNWLVQGGSYAAESTARQRGAIPTTPASANAALMAVNDMNSDESSSLYNKYFAVNSPSSQLSKTLFDVSEHSNNIGPFALSSLGSVFRNFGSFLTAPFGGHAKAATNSDHYKPAAIAGIQTYDFPAQCLDADPLLTTQPKDGTNIQAVLGVANVPDSDLTWDLVNSSDDFYNYVYDKIGKDNPNADDIAKKIYNCNLLDTSVRGGLGALHGYTKDDGYQEGDAGQSSPADTTGPATYALLPSLNGYNLTADESKQVKYIADSVLPLLQGTDAEKYSLAARVTWWSLKEDVLGLHERPTDPYGYSNCGGHHIDMTDPCSASIWQVGIAAIQVANFTPAQVQAALDKVHPGMSTKDVLASVAKLAGVAEGSDTYNKIINSKDVLQKSLLLRDPAIGFTLVDGNIKSECIDSTGSWVSDCSAGPIALAGSQQTANKVIAELKDYFSAPAGGSQSTTGYLNPLRDIPNLSPMRIDQGVDYSGDGPVYAIGNGKVLNTMGAGWPGGVFISYLLTDGPAAGKAVFVAENCTPNVTAPQKVTNTTVICQMHSKWPFIETGWADSSGVDLALAHDVYSEGLVTAYGVNFSQLMQKLGAPAGTGNTSSAVGKLAAGWPTW